MVDYNRIINLQLTILGENNLWCFLKIIFEQKYMLSIRVSPVMRIEFLSLRRQSKWIESGFDVVYLCCNQDWRKRNMQI